MGWLKQPVVSILSVRAEPPGSLPIRFKEYFPAKLTGRLPVLAISPPLNAPPETFAPMAIEVAENGIICVVLDYYGEKKDESRQHLKEDALDTASRDLKAVVAYLRSRPEVDPRKIAVAGQSFGALVAQNAAIDDAQIVAVVMIGMSGDFGPLSPSNVLMISGLYDELHPQKELLVSLASSTGHRIVSTDVVYGDFANGTARSLIEIPSVSHVPEILHPQIIQETIGWISKAFGVLPKKSTFAYSFRACAQWAALLIALILLTNLLQYVGRGEFTNTEDHEALPFSLLRFRVASVTILLLLYGCFAARWYCVLPHTGLLYAAFPIMTAGHLLRRSSKHSRCLSRIPHELSCTLSGLLPDDGWKQPPELHQNAGVWVVDPRLSSREFISMAALLRDSLHCFS